jgi:hypothetical protein
MLGYDVYSFDHNFVLFIEHAGDIALFPFVAAFGDYHIIVGMKSHLKHLWSQRYDPHEVAVTEFASHRAKDSCASGHLVFVDDDSRVVVKFDM